MKTSNLTGFILITVTLLSFYLAETEMQPGLVAIVLMLTSLKASLIIDGFMELFKVSHLVRRSLHLYCPVLAILIWSLLFLPQLD
ncbi:cytochrome C oxidase subunit IV family protein [uncultured Neptuniibacter sp.]|uniref:cytochrome C oxidase subunit IV family protein n=1 Tax=uncultured Neptuniibacter sp. TaxID=502143 RepID=UPI002625A8F0|nr:cytochrome C oxidase subunit IV family protein [uncultured Neptuniibacter sp.]